MASGTRVIAQDAARDSVRAVDLDPVVVTATHAPMPKRDVPGSVTIITNQFIQGFAGEDVMDIASRLTPGMFITERGTMGYGFGPTSAGNISIRGIGGVPNTDVLVLVDGRPNFMGLFGHPLPDAYSSLDVERIEVVRGPSAVLHGSNAMGGVINIITRRAYDRPLTLRGAAGIATHDAHVYSLEGGFQTASVGGRAGYIEQQTDGHRPSSNFKHTGGSAAAAFQLSNQLLLSADASHAGIRMLDPGPIAQPLDSAWFEIERDSFGISLDHEGNTAWWSVRAYLHRGRQGIFDGFRSTDETYALIAHRGFQPFSGNATTVGLDVRHYGGHAKNRNLVEPDFGTHFVTEIGPYAYFTQSLSERAILSTGLRLERHSTFGQEWMPTAGLVYNPLGNVTLKFLVARAFRSPTIRELYLFPAPNPDLQPERAWSYELGVEHRLAPWLKTEVSVFRMEVDNAIILRPIAQGLELANVGEFVSRGVELSVHSNLLPDLAVVGNAYFLGGEVRDPLAPRQMFSLHSAYRLGRVHLMTDVQHVSRAPGAFDALILGDYTSVLSAVKASFSGGLFLSLRINNLVNERYEVIPGYPMPRRTIELRGGFEL